MGFRLRRFRRTVQFMEPMEDSHRFPALAQHSWHMSSEKHVAELITVNLANVGALALSLSEVEQWIRVAGCLLAAVYTFLKIVEIVRTLRK